MSFPPVPPREPLGPARRIGGKHTTAKRMAFAPVRIFSKERIETPVLGVDGAVYRGTGRRTSIIELDRQLRGSKRPISVKTAQSSSKGYVIPSIVALRVEGKSPAIEKPHSALIELPSTDVGKMTELIQKQHKAEPEKRTELNKPDAIESENKKSEITKPGESDPEITELEDIPEDTELGNIESEPEVSDSEVTEPEESEPEVSESEATEPEESEPEVSESEATEPEESEPEVGESEATELENIEPEEEAE